uniref:Mutator-like transposase domain-containing protein n=1 Tax=Trichogramma kaykai TaxID=54128 RepID=A0ABD2VXP0_9HYME
MDRKGSRKNRAQGSVTKKRKFHGNKYTDKMNSDHTSKSAKKLKSDDDFVVHNDPTSSYCILNIFLVFSALQSYVKCKTCDGNLSFSSYGRRGLGFKVCVSCDNCDDRYVDSCPMIGTGYEINRRLVFVMRLIGVGIHGIQLFCGLMDLGDSFNIKTYYDIVKHITTATRAVFDLVTRKTVKEEQRLNIEHELLEEVLTVSGDSSRAKRGFSSLVGIVSLIGKYSGKVIHTVVQSSYCKACEQWKNEKDTFDYECWYDIHKDECPANHEGSAGKMEVDCVVEMFMRSIEKFDVRYGYYIGDGDSKTFKMLLDTSPYGDSFEVKKLECALHVKKRLYKRSAEAKKALTQKKKALAIDEKKKESSKPPIVKKRF